MGSLKKKSKSKGSKLGGLVKTGRKVLGLTSGGSKGTGRRSSRRKSPEYWAKKVLVEKLKKRYFKLKFGGR